MSMRVHSNYKKKQRKKIEENKKRKNYKKKSFCYTISMGVHRIYTGFIRETEEKRNEKK